MSREAAENTDPKLGEKWKMTVTKDVNLGTLMPVIIFLVAQSSAAIWWASTMSADQKNLSRQIADLDTRLEEAVSDSDAEQLRQWERINQNEASIQDEARVTALLGSKLDGLSSTVNDLRFDIRQNNELLRELLSSGRVSSNDP